MCAPAPFHWGCGVSADMWALVDVLRAATFCARCDALAEVDVEWEPLCAECAQRAAEDDAAWDLRVSEARESAGRM